MAAIDLRIRAGVKALNEGYISKRIRAILEEAGCGSADVSGDMLHDYTITGIPKDKAESVH